MLDHSQPWIDEALLGALDHGERSPEFLSSLLLRYVLQDRLVFDGPTPIGPTTAAQGYRQPFLNHRTGLHRPPCPEFPARTRQ